MISQEMLENEWGKICQNFFLESGIPDPDFPGFTLYEFWILGYLPWISNIDLRVFPNKNA